MGDRFEALRIKLEDAVLDAPGETDAAARRRALDGQGATPELTAFLERVQRHAHRITDEDVDALKAAGHGDDEILELLLSAALGAARERLFAGLRAMKGGARATEEGR